SSSHRMVSTCALLPPSAVAVHDRHPSRPRHVASSWPSSDNEPSRLTFSRRIPLMSARSWTVALLSALLLAPALSAGTVGYYRQPALHGDTLVFVSEGDLWKVHVKGGVATRLTSHPGEEGRPAISPDGMTLAFTAQYEGATEVYTMPLSGGRP